MESAVEASFELRRAPAQAFQVGEKSWLGRTHTLKDDERKAETITSVAHDKLVVYFHKGASVLDKTTEEANVESTAILRNGIMSG